VFRTLADASQKSWQVLKVDNTRLPFAGFVNCLQAALNFNEVLGEEEVSNLGMFAVKELTTKKVAPENDLGIDLTEWAKMSCAASPGPRYDLMAHLVDSDHKWNLLEKCMMPPHLSKTMSQFRKDRGGTALGVSPQAGLESCASLGDALSATPEIVTDSSAEDAAIKNWRKYIDDAVEEAVLEKVKVIDASLSNFLSVSERLESRCANMEAAVEERLLIVRIHSASVILR